ncbi:MAG: hypothetical protein AAFX85_18250, partial [Pseudomonadota bacterium]
MDGSFSFEVDDYEGPLRIVVSPGVFSTYECDLPPACFVDDQVAGFGAPLPYNVALEAVVASVDDAEGITVSLLSDLVSARVRDLGALSAATVQQAEAQISQQLASVYDFSALGITLPSSLTQVELIDLLRPVASDTPDVALLSLLNVSLLAAGMPGESLQSFLDRLRQSALVSPEDEVPLGGDSGAVINRASLLTAFAVL